MNPDPNPRYHTWDVNLHKPGMGYVASPRYEQGRWFAEFLVKLLLAVGVIVAVAALVYLTVAMFAGVQA